MTVYITRCTNGCSIYISERPNGASYFVDHRTGTRTKGKVFFNHAEKELVGAKDAKRVAADLQTLFSKWYETCPQTKINFAQSVNETLQEAIKYLNTLGESNGCTSK